MNLERASLAGAMALAMLALGAGHARASASPAAQAVLAQEARWLAAICNGDVKTVAAILSENAVHTNSSGQVFDRAADLAGVKKEPFTMHPSEQTVDIVGNVAIVHGLNTIVRGGKTVTRERYTDVYVKRSGAWLALSSQETTVAK